MFQKAKPSVQVVSSPEGYVPVGDLKPGCHLRGSVCFCVHRDPLVFYFRSNGSRVMNQAFDKTTEELAKHMERSNIKADKFQPQVGEHCAVFNADQPSGWFRVKLLRFIEEDYGEIFYLDFGLTQIVLLSRLRYLPERFLQVPAQVVRCHLDGITGPFKIDKLLRQKLKNLLQDKELVLFVESVRPCVGHHDDVIYVTAYDDQHELSINTRMVRLGYGTSGKVHERLSHVNVLAALSDTAGSSKWTRRPLQTHVVASHVISPSQFYVNLLPELANFIDILNEIDSSSVPADDIRTGKIYGIRTASGLNPGRGLCLGETTATNTYRFFLIDRGYEDDFAASHVYNISDVCSSHRPLAVECSLHIECPSVWPESCKLFFADATARGPMKLTLFSEEKVWKVDLSQVEAFIDSPVESLVEAIRDRLAVLEHSSVPIPGSDPSPNQVLSSNSKLPAAGTSQQKSTHTLSEPLLETNDVPGSPDPIPRLMEQENDGSALLHRQLEQLNRPIKPQDSYRPSSSRIQDDPVPVPNWNVISKESSTTDGSRCPELGQRSGSGGSNDPCSSRSGPRILPKYLRKKSSQNSAVEDLLHSILDSASKIDQIEFSRCPFFAQELNPSAHLLGSMPTASDCVLEVDFLECLSPQVVYVRPVSFGRHYQQLKTDLQFVYNHFDRQRPQKIEADSKTLYVAFVRGQWSRIVVQILYQHYCSAKDVDSGQSYVIATKAIFNLHSAFQKYPIMALLCSLSDWNVDSHWNAHHLNGITEILLESDTIYISCPQHPSVFSLDSLSVSLISHHQMDGESWLINVGEVLSTGVQVSDLIK